MRIKSLERLLMPADLSENIQVDVEPLKESFLNVEPIKRNFFRCLWDLEP